MGGVVSAYGRKKRPAGSSGRHVADDSLREASSVSSPPAASPIPRLHLSLARDTDTKMGMI